jgi:hypothetical protein
MAGPADLAKSTSQVRGERTRRKHSPECGSRPGDPHTLLFDTLSMTCGGLHDDAPSMASAWGRRM